MHGALEYRNGDSVITLLTKQELVPNEGDAWQFALDAVGRYLERAMAVPEADRPGPLKARRALDLASVPTSEADADLLNGFPDTAELLGKRTAEMHAALADADDEAFEPEPLSKLYLRSLYQTLRNGIRRPMQTLANGAGRLTGEAAELAQRVVARRDEMIERIGLVRELPLEGARIRCHGDYHLGQVLWTGADFYIIDFEGEPMRTLGERRLKRTALSDVAGMCRSLDYAAHAGLRRLESQGLAEGPTANDASLSTLAERWSTHATAAFLRGYFGSVREGLTPASTDATARLLDAWTMHKAAYEVQYELNNRPDWITIPLRGILTILGDTERSKPD